MGAEELFDWDLKAGVLERVPGGPQQNGEWFIVTISNEMFKRVLDIFCNKAFKSKILISYRTLEQNHIRWGSGVLHLQMFGNHWLYRALVIFITVLRYLFFLFNSVFLLMCLCTVCTRLLGNSLCLKVFRIQTSPCKSFSTEGALKRLLRLTKYSWLVLVTRWLFFLYHPQAGICSFASCSWLHIY